MFNRIINTLAAGCLLLAAVPASADHEHAGDTPFYFGFALGFPGSDQDCDYYGYNCDGSDTSFKVYGGKRLHENFGIEISFQDLGKLKNKDFDLTTSAESEGVNISLLGIIPVADIGYFYGKAGYMLSDTRYTRITPGNVVTSDDDSEDFTYGAGFAFVFNRKYDFRIEFERLNDLNDDFVPGGDYITSISFGGTIYLE